MQWYFLAFLSPLLWAISNHIDKYILSRYLKNANTGVLAIFAGLVGFLFSLGVLILYSGNILEINFLNRVVIILNGSLLIIAFIPYYYALRKEDASSIVPLYQTIPIFSFILGFLILKETINTTQIFAGILIIFGAILVSIDLEKPKISVKSRILFLMLLSSLLLAIHFLVFKFIALQATFWITIFWEYLGAAAVAVFLLIFIKNYREQFITVIKENSIWVIFINVINEIINIVAKLFANYASLLVPVVVVNLANGLQPMFVFLIGLFITIFLPFINKEKIVKKHVIQRIIAIFILLVGTYMLIN